MTFKKIKNNKKLILNDYISRLVSKKKLDKKMLMEDREKLFETTKICIKIDESVTKKEWLKI